MMAGFRRLGGVGAAMGALAIGLSLSSCAGPAGGSRTSASVPAAGAAAHGPGGAEDAVGHALRNLDERRYRQALADLDRAETLAPGSGEIQGYRAMALFRTERYEDAEAAATLALARDPELFWVLPTLWDARIEADGGSAESKAAVAEDIRRRLRSEERRPQLLFAAYRGLGGIGERSERIALLLEMCELTEGSDLAGDVANALFEEALQARDPEELFSLASSYVQLSPDGRMAFHATRMLLRASDPMHPGVDPADLPVLEAADRHRGVAAGLGSWLVEEERDAAQAVALLERSLSLLEEQLDAPPPPHFTADLWVEELRGERAVDLIFLGRAQRLTGDLAAARRSFEKASESAPDLADPEYQLGLLALEEHRRDEALTRLRRAVERSGRRPEAEELLGRLLMEMHGWQGEPRAFFLRREGGVNFTDVTGPAGLEGVRAERVAWCDLDGDGRDDLLLGGRQIFANLGDGTFAEISGGSEFSGSAGANGAACGDFDGDGSLDFVSTGRTAVRLWRNAGKGRFVDATGPELRSSGPRQTEAAAWGDLDNDGDLDLYLANYENPGVALGLCVQDQLLRNDGTGGFTDVSDEAGILSEEAMCGRGVTWVDLDEDGNQDVVVANYRLDPNFLWLNGGDGKLRDVAEDRGIRGTEVSGAFGHSIGAVAGDLDGDGHADLFVSNLAHPRYIEFSDRSQLLLGSGPPGFRFTDRFEESGISFEETNSDPALADVDADGDLDLYVTSIYPGRYAHLYLNDGRGRFADRTWLAGTRVENGWGAAFADFDGDGDADLVVGSRDGIRLFRNDTAGGTWVAVGIRDRRCNRFGVGAKVTVRYGGKSQTREIAAGRGTGSQDSLTLLFGLGTHRGPVDVEAVNLCGDTFGDRLPTPNREVILANP